MKPVKHIKSTFSLPLSKAEWDLLDQMEGGKFEELQNRLFVVSEADELEFCEEADGMVVEYTVRGKPQTTALHEAIQAELERVFLREATSAIPTGLLALPGRLQGTVRFAGSGIEQVRDVLLGYALNKAGKGGPESEHVERLRLDIKEASLDAPDPDLVDAYMEPLNKGKKAGWEADRQVRCLMDFIRQHEDPVKGDWLDAMKRLSDFVEGELEQEQKILVSLSQDEEPASAPVAP